MPCAVPRRCSYLRSCIACLASIENLRRDAKAYMQITGAAWREQRRRSDGALLLLLKLLPMGAGSATARYAGMFLLALQLSRSRRGLRSEKKISAIGNTAGRSKAGEA